MNTDNAPMMDAMLSGLTAELDAVGVTVTSGDGNNPVLGLLEAVAAASADVVGIHPRFRDRADWSLFDTVAAKVFASGTGLDASSDRCDPDRARLFAVVAVFEVAATLSGESLEARLTVT